MPRRFQQHGQTDEIGGIGDVHSGLGAQESTAEHGGFADVQVGLGAQESVAQHGSLTDAMHKARLKAARTAMKQRWMELGGADSLLGLPIYQSFPIHDADGNITMNFRGGTMHVLSDGETIVEPDHIAVDASYRVAISFEGMGLEIRQEGDGDELYGTLSLTDGSRRRIEDFTIPQTTLGPEANQRIYQTSMQLFNDRPPSDISIAIKVFEHDSGDRDKMRAEIRKRVHQVFEKAMEEVGGAVGGPVGAAAAAMQRESGADNSLTNWVVTGLADGIDEFLGLGDDEYNGAILAIPYEEQLNLRPLQVYRCAQDPRTIEYTHKVTVNSRDDANDLGQVTLLFKVRKAS